MSFLDNFIKAIDPENIDKAVSQAKSTIVSAVDSLEENVEKAEKVLTNVGASGQKVSKAIEVADKKIPG